MWYLSLSPHSWVAGCVPQGWLCVEEEEGSYREHHSHQPSHTEGVWEGRECSAVGKTSTPHNCTWMCVCITLAIGHHIALFHVCTLWHCWSHSPLSPPIVQIIHATYLKHDREPRFKRRDYWLNEVCVCL